ncbi:MAG: hypothetical protein VKL39_16310 [Leptolyngbyaceae bacterium]|nr:hypothetical protein [Leptolyngbyaceae bacterium]
MAFPHHPNHRFIQDIKVLFKRKPRVMSVGIGVVGLAAIALSTQSLFRGSASSDNPSPEASALVERLQNSSNTDALEGNERSIEESDISTDIDTLEVLLSGSELSGSEQNEDSEQSPPQSSQSGSRSPSSRFSSLLDPSSLAASTGTTTHNQNQRGTSSMYEDLFQPITLSDHPGISASVPSLLSTTPTVSSTGQPSVLRSQGFLNANSSDLPSEQSGTLPVTSSLRNGRESIEGRSTNGSGYDLPGSSLTANQRRSSTGLPSVEATSLTNGIFSTPTDGVFLQSAPYPGTTGYTLPQALRSPVNPYTQQVNPQFAPAISGQTIISPLTIVPNAQVGTPFVPLGAQSTFNRSSNLSPSLTPTFPSIQQPAFTIPQNSFAAPATLPSTDTRFNGGGRGGEFNTFSNP